MRIQSLAGAWEFRQAGTEEWLPASVPGGVHTDLLALGRIPDPFVADNEKRVQWVAEVRLGIPLSVLRCSPELLAEDTDLSGLRRVGYSGDGQSSTVMSLGTPTTCSAGIEWDVKAAAQMLRRK